MTNEEKAREIANDAIYCYSDACDAALDMAQWKDQQFKEYGNFLLWIRDRLEYVYHEKPNVDYMLKFQKIINEFLGEEAK